MPDTANSPEKTGFFKWWICILLLLATTINYMDRMALTQSSKRIVEYFQLTKAQYGQIESAFNAAFAIGALAIGILVDRHGPRAIYPLVVIMWSLAGFAAGFAQSFAFLIVCRFWLGLFEAGNWPCGIVTVKRVLKPEERSLGNGMFHSGTALGAILMPQVVLLCLMYTDPDGISKEAIVWQFPFRIVGAIGLAWAVLWWFTIRPQHIRPPEMKPIDDAESYWSIFSQRRFWLLLIMLVAINFTWRSFGTWMGLFLSEGKGYSETSMNHITSGFFLAADLGSILMGAMTLAMARRGIAIHTARLICFVICATLTLLSIVVVKLPTGTMFVVVLFIVGFAALGLFPTYFALSQEISVKHQGKVTGTLGCLNGLFLAVVFPIQGYLVDRYGNYEISLGLAGVPPIVAFALIAFFWNQKRVERTH
jgi:MFS transporter, ACS family, hexuronate transporter